MSSMRLFTKKEFEAELYRLKLHKTDHEAENLETFRVWKDEHGHSILVPELPEGESYPDFFLDEIIGQINKLRQDGFSAG